MAKSKKSAIYKSFEEGMKNAVKETNESSFHVTEYTITNTTIRVYEQDDCITFDNFNDGSSISIHKDLAPTLAKAIIALLEQLPE